MRSRPHLHVWLFVVLFAAACAQGPVAPTPTPIPDSPAAFVAQGDRLLAESDFAGAEAAYRAALDLDSDYARAWSHLSYLHLFNPTTRKTALDEARKATELAPESAEAWAYLARAQDWNGDFDDARVSGEKAVDLDPDNADAHSFLGEVYTDLRMYDEAEQAAERAVQLDPDNAEARRNLGYYYADAGRKDDALREWQAAYGLQPRFTHRWTSLAAFYRGMRPDPDEARRWIEGALDLHPDDATSLLMLARLESDLGRAEAARAACERLRVLAPETTDGHNCFGNLHLDAGDHGAAQAEFRAALGVDPEDEPSLLNLGYALYLTGDCAGALTQFQTAADLYPRSGDAQALIGLAHACAGEFDSAQAAYAEAVDLEPYEGDHYIGLVRVHMQTGDLARAEREAELAIELDPDQAAYHFWLGRVKAAQGDADSATEAYRKASTLDPRSALYSGALGFVHLGRQEYGDADEAFREAVARIEQFPSDDSQSAEVYFGWGVSRALQGDCVAAVDLLERSLRLDSSQAEAQQFLTQCRQQLGLAGAPLPVAIASGGPLPDDGAQVLLAQTLENWGLPANVTLEVLQDGSRVLAAGYLTRQSPGSEAFVAEQAPVVYAASWLIARVTPQLDGAVVYALDSQGFQLNTVVVRQDVALLWVTGALDDREFASLWREVR